MTEDKTIQNQTCAYVDERAPFFFLVLSRKGEIVKANAYARQLTGRSLVGERFSDAIIDFAGDFDLRKVLEDTGREHLMHVGLASGLPQSLYFTFRPSDGGMMVFGRLDAEEIDIMRTEILSLNQDLGNLTRELHRKNAQLKRLNEEKNRFLGMASHDLRKPIGLVTTYSDFLIEEAEGVLENEHIGFLRTINASCAFMKRLVDDFLDVSAIEAGKFELDLQPTRFRDVLAAGLQLNSLQAAKKGVDLQVSCDEKLPQTMMDPSKIEQAVINLVSNAIEHTDPHTAVAISAHNENQSIHFAVQDTGPGIAPEEMKKLFKPFGRTSTQKTSGEKSTGLGMLITRKIIEAHDGELWIDSRVGFGTTVHFKLPTRKG